MKGKRQEKPFKLSKRGELLAIRVKNKIDQLKASVPRPASGVPLNALPGWADVPLYEKLPMLDCPNNQIVFTNSKIGRGIPSFPSEYDTNCQNDVNEYNSLNDPHLRDFYSRERNLDLLKKCGIITRDNYVICNLYEFNAYRRLLNRFHLFLIHKELERREQEQEDRAMIVHAETVAQKEYQKRILKADYRDPIKVLQLKQQIFNDKMEKNKLNLKNLDEKFLKYQKMRDLKSLILKQKAQLHKVAIEQKQMIASDILRKNVIVIKKHLKLMNDISTRHMKIYKENKLKEKLDKKSVQWNKRIQNTIETHEKNTALMSENEAIKCKNIQKRIEKSERQWRRIQKRIAQNSKSKSARLKLGAKSRRNNKSSRKSSDKRFSGTSGTVEAKIAKKLKNEFREGSIIEPINKSFSISKLTCKDIEDAVHTAIDLQEDLCPSSYTSENIYEAAKYIIEQVLINIDYDLNYNTHYYDILCTTIDEIFDKIQFSIIEKVRLVLKDFHIKEPQNSCPRSSYARSVSFCDFSPVIGTSSLQEGYMFCGPINVKSVKERAPTPAGSLTSITVALEDHVIVKRSSEICKSQKERNEKIFLGHFLIKFKRKLLVGVSQKVFLTIREFFESQSYEINKQLLEVDKVYLRNEVAKSILGYSQNKYNFYAILRLCTGALSSNILYILQEQVFNQQKSKTNQDSINEEDDVESLTQK